MRDFKKILAWQRAHALGAAIHECSRGFGRAGHPGLKSQLGRSADSIAANIVEGCCAATQREFARYLDISIKSATETEHHLLVARDRGALPHDEWERLSTETVEIRRMLHGLRKRVLT